MSINISKVNYNESKYGISFEKLDTNKDGVITKDDLNKAESSEVKNVINKLLKADKDTESTFISNKASVANAKGAAKIAADEEEETNETTDTSSTNTYDTIVAELKSKYAYTSGGTAYTMDSAVLQALKKAVDDGVITELVAKGFTQTQIVSIISEVFPDAGISPTSTGGYTCPNGHDAGSRELFQTIRAQISTANTPTTLALQEKIASLNLQIANNNLRLNELKGAIDSLVTEIEQDIEEAIQESEEIAEEQKESASNIVSSELSKYKAGNMTREEFESSLSGQLNTLESDGESKISEVVLKLVRAEDKMATLDQYIAEFGALNEENLNLKDELDETIEEYEEEKEKAAQESQDSVTETDPIGFEVNNVQYDFFIDDDGDEKLSNETEFLGAKNGWSELTALDLDNDKKVTGAEMKGLKVVATSADGTQTIQDASEVFGEADFIDLSSYNATNELMENGNTLLGTFNVNIDGQEVGTGYNTLDKVDWLDANYDFSDADNGFNRFSYGNTEAYTMPIDYTSQYKEYLQTYSDLEEKLEEAWNSVRLNREDMVVTNTTATDEASSASQTASTANAKARKAKTATASSARAKAETEAKAKADTVKAEKKADSKQQAKTESKKADAAKKEDKADNKQQKVKAAEAAAAKKANVKATDITTAMSDYTDEEIEAKISQLESKIEELEQQRSDVESKAQALEKEEDKTPAIQARLMQYSALKSEYNEKIKELQKEILALEAQSTQN